MFTNCSFDTIRNKLNCCKDEDCLERFCKDLREHAMTIINYEKKMILLTTEEMSIMKCKKFFTYTK